MRQEVAAADGAACAVGDVGGARVSPHVDSCMADVALLLLQRRRRGLRFLLERLLLAQQRQRDAVGGDAAQYFPREGALRFGDVEVKSGVDVRG